MLARRATDHGCRLALQRSGRRMPNVRKKTTVGFVGVGSMGGPMASYLLRAGHAIIAHDTSTAAVEELREKAQDASLVQPAATPADAAAGADKVLCVCVVNEQQVESCLFGERGAVAALHPESVVVMHSTVPPSFARSLGQRLASAGGHFLVDAPISGGRIGAVGGRLAIMASGADKALAVALPLLHTMTPFGCVAVLGNEPGMGSTAKAVNQLLVSTHVVATAEAMAMGASGGLDLNALRELIVNCAGTSWIFESRSKRLVGVGSRGGGEFRPTADDTSTAAILLKDMDICCAVGGEAGLSLPVADMVQRQFSAAVKAGHGQLNDSAVYKLYEDEGAGSA